MRYESKHSVLKTIANRAKNHVNVCKTVAIRHQRVMAASLREPTYMSDHKVDNFKPADQTAKQAVLEDTSSTDGGGDQDVCVGTSVSVNGTRFVKGDVVVLTGDDSDLSFGCVNLVVVHPGSQVKLNVTVLDWTYDAHVNAFKVRPTGCRQLLDVKDLAAPHPLKNYRFQSEDCVVLKYYVH